MTPSEHDDRQDAYLWDPAAPVDEDVRRLEDSLRALRFDPETTPLNGPVRAPSIQRPRRWVYSLAAAATVLVIVGTFAADRRWRWPAGQAWPIETGPSGTPDRLAVGTPLALGEADEARIKVARIGTLRMHGGGRLTLQSTQGTRHRMTLERGSVHVRVWAPPGSVVIRTPAGEVIDLGCEFDLSVNETTTALQVRSGWVQLANRIAEILVPAGAGTEMRANRAPGVPVFIDAAPGFAAAVRRLEAGDGDPGGNVEAIVANARPRDVFTLLMLIERRSVGRDRIAARAAELSPPPAGVTVQDVLADRDALWRWRDTLPLPPPKSWLRNWRDALPAWLMPGR